MPKDDGLVARQIAQLQDVVQEQHLQLTVQMIAIRMMLAERIDPANRQASEDALLAQLRGSMARMAAIAGYKPAELKEFTQRIAPHVEAIARQAAQIAPPEPPAG